MAVNVLIEEKGLGMNLTIELRLLPKIRKSGVILHIPLHALLAWTRITSILCFMKVKTLKVESSSTHH